MSWQAELYIVIGGVMVGILSMGSFAASHDIGFLSQQDHVYEIPDDKVPKHVGEYWVPIH
jgi:hypothetical protein